MNEINIRRYRTFVFDCDGVILDSNPLKTDAFREIGRAYGDDVAEALVNYHKCNAGASRYKKFGYLLEHLLGVDPEADKVTSLAAAFANLISTSLRTCVVASRLQELREFLNDARWMVVSGSDQTELRQLFAERRLDGYFDGGIFGSPDSKDIILAREFEAGRLIHPALFLGDSRYDHEAATRAGLDFVFVSDWTEFKEWSDYITTHQLPVIAGLRDLLT